MRPTREHHFIPARTYELGQPPPTLGDGFLAINIPERRLWIGGANGTVIEVTDLGQLIECYIETIDRHGG